MWQSGAIHVEIESEMQCSCEPLTGRKWDRRMARPSCVALSEAEWQDFAVDIGKLVRSFVPEVRGAAHRCAEEQEGQRAAFRVNPEPGGAPHGASPAAPVGQ